MGDPILNESVLKTALNPASIIPASELALVFGLVVMACYDRKVERDFMMDTIEQAMNGIRLLRGLDAEVFCIRGCELPLEEKQQKMFQDMADLSLKEINGVRRNLMDRVTLLQECPTAQDSIS